jgi:hypothetical protein
MFNINIRHVSDIKYMSLPFLQTTTQIIIVVTVLTANVKSLCTDPHELIFNLLVHGVFNMDFTCAINY